MRSKSLLASNILVTVYTIFLLWTFGGIIFAVGALESIYYIQEYFGLVFSLIAQSSASLTVLYVVFVLLVIHIVTFTLGFIFGWIGYGLKKNGFATTAAVLYTIGTVCFPAFIIPGLAITILGYVGSSNQKKLNSVSVNN